ncbi:hypothetical protein, variant [Capsaspora owczarzaki ATCC 30864]|nr:hypothetical protein, variant [Capsaspora owczarzaki ATCC 30864]
MLRTARFFRLPLAPIKAALFSAARRSPAAAAFRAADPTAKCLSTKAAATTIVQRPDGTLPLLLLLCENAALTDHHSHRLLLCVCT